MMNVDELKAFLARSHPEFPGSAVVDLLVAGYRGPGTVYAVAEVAHKTGGSSSAALATLQLLAAPDFSVLHSRWVYFDSEGEQFDLKPEKVADARESGEFFHPLSGAPVLNYEQSIGLVYEAGPGFPRP